MREPDPCPAGEDLSAYALGEGSPAGRAGLARHLLACTACRAACEDDQRLVLGLRALGAARSLPAQAPPAPVRARRWLAWAPPLAASLLVGLALLLPSDGEERGAPPAPGPAQALASDLPAHAQHLLATQRADGSWPGEAGADERTATALALLALDTLPQAAAPGSGPGPLGAARARGLRLLASSVGPVGQGARREAAAAQALLLSALCGPGAGQLEPLARPAAESLLHALLRRAQDGMLDASSLPWVAYALARAEGCDLPAAGRLRASLPREALAAAADPGGPPGLLGPLHGRGGASEGVPCTPLRTALEVLHDAPPLRGLALGPACRLPLLARAP